MGFLTIGRMMAVDDFIGSTFPTPAGGILTVVGCDGRRNSNSGKIYQVSCSICSLDVELFGSGLFYSPKGSLTHGSVCCGCSVAPKWTLHQYELRLKRSMIGSKYTFVRWADESAKASNTNKFVYNCADHGERVCNSHKWMSGVRCKDCDSDNQRKSQAEFIEDAKRVHGDKYDYSLVEYTTTYNKVEIICPEHGSFSQKAENHLCGSGCLKCYNDRRRKTTDSFITNAKLVHGDKYDYSLVDYTTTSSKVEIICPEHGSFSQKAASHLKGSGCTSCANRGFDAGKPASVYVLRIEGMQGEFTGYGITGNVDQRLRRHTNKLRQSGFGIVESIVFDFDDGQTALDIENMLKAEFPMTPQEVEGFLTEATFADQFANVVNFVQQQETVLS